MPKSPRSRRSRLLPALIGLVVSACVLLAGWQLFAGHRWTGLTQWAERAEQWRTVLGATADAIADGSLRPDEGGGFIVPWEEQGKSHPFPLGVDEIMQELRGMTAAYPLPLVEQGEGGDRITESHEILRLQVEALARLGPLASLRLMPQALRHAAADVQVLIQPVRVAALDEAREARAAALALAATALVCAILLLLCALRARALRRDRDRLARHAAALRSNTIVPGA